MSNEIFHNFPSGNTLYAIIHKKTDDTVNITGTNNFEAWVDGNIDTYDVPLAQGEIFWDGTQEIDIGTINITNQTVTNIYDESTPPPVVVIFG